MAEFDDTVTAYLDTWNATDTAQRRRCWKSIGRRASPTPIRWPMCSGHDGISGAIEAVQAQFPGYAFTLSVDRMPTTSTCASSGVGPRDTEPVVVGFDVLSTDPEGRIQTVLGFLDQLPA